MKKQSFSKTRWAILRKTAFDYFVKHKIVSLLSAVIVFSLLTTGAYALWRHQTAAQQASVVSTNTDMDKKAFEGIDAEQIAALDKLGVPEDAVDNSDPVKSTAGKCKGWYYDDGNGHFSITTREADGSYKCITYDLNDLKDYKSADGSSSASSSVDANTGSRTTVLKSTDKTGTSTTTTTVTRPDGSSQTSTDGGWWKVCFDKAGTICINTNSTEMTTNFMTCKLQSVSGGDYRLATPSELTGRGIYQPGGAAIPCSSISLPNIIS